MTRTARSVARAVTTLFLLLGLIGCGADAPERHTPTAGSPTPVSTDTSEPPTTRADQVDVSVELESLEQEFGARVGLSALNTSTGTSAEYRAEERFGFASTLKLFAAAEFLRQVPAKQRDTRITWTTEVVEAAGYSPVTSEHPDDGLTLAELAEAAVRQSDNAAMNFVLEEIGGPTGLENGLATLGDSTTRVVDNEPALNDVDPASTDNTTTAAAFTANLRVLFEQDHLPQEDTILLMEWMSGNASGDPLVRAGAPAGWVVADKSGGAGGIRNDVAIVTPLGGEPILLTIMTERHDPDAEYDDALVARTAQVVLAALE